MIHRRGFSLVELLVVIGVIGVLVGLALPAVQAARDTASRAACQNRLRQLGVGLHNYHSARGCFPYSSFGVNPAAVGAATPDEILSWMANILPYLEQQALYDQASAACRAERLAYLDPPHTGNSTPVAAFVCPADQRLTRPLTTPTGRSVALTSYIGVAGSGLAPNILPQQEAPGGGFDWHQVVRLTDITDGTSNTIHVAERPPPDTAQAGEWYQSAWGREIFPGPTGTMYYFQAPFVVDADPCPSSLYGPGRTDNPCDRYHFWSLHRGGANFLYCDGAVRFLPYTAASAVMSALCTRAWNEVVEQP
ncbi:DUF1559 domain-containing protein [Fimbriiglobus ruber]|uniref:DUF1559 domain-containing protein n=1 Tax=Fimbriiglobus ruber TaxID=1908690 RepID=UPI00137A5147|nr:DUF1559 domain-containing protein [Fimbriiglobus ruber]